MFGTGFKALCNLRCSLTLIPCLFAFWNQPGCQGEICENPSHSQRHSSGEFQIEPSSNCKASKRNIKSLRHHRGHAKTPESLFSDVNYIMNKTMYIKQKREKENTWKQLPSLNIARSRFPSIIILNERLAIAGGKCLPNNMQDCNMVELLNTTACEWEFDKQPLQLTRYNHNSISIPSFYCKLENPFVFRNQGFNVGH